MDELTREFLIESQEGLDRMERCLTDLEERPEDTDLLGEIFRSVHTGENLLALLRDGKLSANQPVITGLLQLMDALRGVLRIIETQNHEGEVEDADSALIARLRELQQLDVAAITVASRNLLK
jgi:two-component system chemotaxis sensor kinase CheA